MRPLEGLFVLDFTTLLPGPMATLLLAEAGAEVVKVERPEGEDMRAYPAPWGRDSVYFALLNRGKKSLALDLKNPADRAALEPLLARSDIVVEQFRPGVMARLGLGPADVAAINPKAIYCSITGYGQTGPRADEAGHDLNYIGHTGLLALNPWPLDRPVVPPALIADIAGGTLPAVMNILLALRQRDQTGHGCHLDIAMTDAMFTFASHALVSGHATGTFPAMGGARLTGGSPRYQLYQTKDGKLVCCAALEQRFWEPFTAMIGLSREFIDDSRDPAATKAAIAGIIAGRSADEWRPLFAAADCCVTIMATLEEALRDPHFVERGLFAHQVAGPTGATMPALPVPINPQFRADPRDAKSVPKLSE
jgi:alpha-methylacyl-CoA racemase